MIIVFANQKGGAGKTTNCLLFANYLAMKNIETLVLDLDFQRSIIDRRKEDLELYGNPPLYEVIEASMSEVGKLLEDFGSIDQGNLLIDLPGKVDDDNIIPILQNADIIIIPFKYDKLTMDSTGFFIQLLKHLELKPNVKMFFLPNDINKAVKYETKDSIQSILKQHGIVTEEIPSRVALERVNTLLITDEALNIIKKPYDLIIKEGKIK